MIALIKIKVNKLDYIFKKFNKIILGIFVLVIILAIATFSSRLYQLDKENKAFLADQAEQAALIEANNKDLIEANNKEKGLLDTTTDSMFKDVLKTPTPEGLVFMDLYAVAIEDDTITLPEYKALSLKYKEFIATRDDAIASSTEPQLIDKTDAPVSEK